MKQLTTSIPKLTSAVAILFAVTGSNAFAAGPANTGNGNPNTINLPFTAAFTISELLTLTGVASCPVAGMISGIGETNLFGKAVLAATDCVTMPLTPQGNFIFNEGKFVLTTTSGETIIATYSGEFGPTSTPGVYTIVSGKYSIIGGTGRYVRAYGQGTLSGDETLSPEPFKIPATGNLRADGVISY